MLKISAKNAAGQTLNLTGNSAYIVTSVRGVNPPNANINTSELATMDGAMFNSAFLQTRNIVITVYPVGSVESARTNLYNYFRTKKYVKLFLETASRAVWIDGYVENIDTDLYTNKENLQISIICPDPWFKDQTTSQTTLNGSTTVSNPSDDEIGVAVEVTLSGAAEGFSLTNATNSQTFGVNYTFQSGDKLLINTRRGEKSVSLVRSGVTTNLMNSLIMNSKWIQLEIGNNTLSFTATSGAANMTTKVTVQSIYEGI